MERLSAVAGDSACCALALEESMASNWMLINIPAEQKLYRPASAVFAATQQRSGLSFNWIQLSSKRLETRSEYLFRISHKSIGKVIERGLECPFLEAHV
jgi:hypothetical protein